MDEGERARARTAVRQSAMEQGERAFADAWGRLTGQRVEELEQQVRDLEAQLSTRISPRQEGALRAALHASERVREEQTQEAGRYRRVLDNLMLTAWPEGDAPETWDERIEGLVARLDPVADNPGYVLSQLARLAFPEGQLPDPVEVRAELNRRVLDYPREAAEHKRLSGMLSEIADALPSDFVGESVDVVERVRRLAQAWIATSQRVGARPVATVDKDEMSAYMQRLIAAAWPGGTSGELDTLVTLLERRLEGERTSEDEDPLAVRLDRILPDRPGSIVDRAQGLLNERAQLAAQVEGMTPPESDVNRLAGELMNTKMLELAASDAEQGGYFALEAIETFQLLEQEGWRFVPPERGP